MPLRVSPERPALSSIWNISRIQSTWCSKLFISLRKSTAMIAVYTHDLHPGSIESTQDSVDTQHAP